MQYKDKKRNKKKHAVIFRLLLRVPITPSGVGGAAVVGAAAATFGAVPPPPRLLPVGARINAAAAAVVDIGAPWSRKKKKNIYFEFYSVPQSFQPSTNATCFTYIAPLHSKKKQQIRTQS